MPRLKLLSNGSYHVVVTDQSAGYSHWNRLAVTRWREDAMRAGGGTFFYLRDADDGHVWSATDQPMRARGDACVAHFDGDTAVLRRCDHGIETMTEIAVAMDEDLELRRLRITNLSSRRRRLTVTSLAEIVLSPALTDSAHPAFSKIFVETEIDVSSGAIVATRRPSAPKDPRPWFFHAAYAPDASGAASYETDRASFIGRGRDSGDPQALLDDGPLPGHAGPVLDAVAAIRIPLELQARASCTVDWFTGMAGSRPDCLALASRSLAPGSGDRVLAQAGRHRTATLRGVDASAGDGLVFERLASALLCADPGWRGDAEAIAKNQRGQSGLWRFGISGDLPVVLLRAADTGGLGLVRQLVQAQAFWSAYGVECELMIVCGSAATAEPLLLEEVQRTIGDGIGAKRLGKPGGIFVRDDATLDDGERTLLASVARIVVSDGDGSLAEQMALHERRERAPPREPPAKSIPSANGEETSADATASADEPNSQSLVAWNGFGGFSADLREYVITTSASHMTPAPWVNVIANPEFGTLISESGSASTWSENAHEFRLTPWSNDPVSDPDSEAFFIRDEDSGRFWSPTLLPTRAAGPYLTRHGFGYSSFEHVEDDIESELRAFVAIDAPVKFSKLTLRNRSARRRRLSVTGYCEWVLGDERTKTLMHVVTGLDEETGALLARNGYNTDFSGRTAFFDVEGANRSACGDRRDFVGNAGTLAAPAAMAEANLSGILGAALDPCAALRVTLDLAPGEESEVVFRLGAGKSVAEAHDLVRRWRGADAARAALDGAIAFWRKTLGAVQVRTQEATIDALANGWLLYQVIGSRLWGRTAFYQSSGAFGFRDQLQDVMALVHCAPGLVREHLLRSASRQFVEGDVQHWWHPPTGKGVRTRCSDDYLWLPFVASRYVEVSGDDAVLDTACPFLEGRPLQEGETSNYESPAASAQQAPLYEHCVRAIRRGFRYGAHGLPLMGGGDWNDGMNLVGAGGKGESVWLAFFLIAVLKRFAPLASARGDTAFAELCASEAAALQQRIEATSWDGDWYRRAWFDDGTPLGSAGNAECQIDSIAQSWAVISGAAPAGRAQTAMASVHRQLVHGDRPLVQLLDPPFDKFQPNPGYIEGYLRGVRENGGQYTHAAVWVGMAFAALGDAKRAWEVFTMIDPINHATSADAISIYKTEPYVLASDVYALAPHVGRGGWTWYTGSAGWMYRFIVESLLGLRLDVDKLYFTPCLPADWTTFTLHYRYRETAYHISVVQAAGGETRVTVDGVEQSDQAIPLVDDRVDHVVAVHLPRAHG